MSIDRNAEVSAAASNATASRIFIPPRPSTSANATSAPPTTPAQPVAAPASTTTTQAPMPSLVSPAPTAAATVVNPPPVPPPDLNDTSTGQEKAVPMAKLQEKKDREWDVVKLTKFAKGASRVYDFIYQICIDQKKVRLRLKFVNNILDRYLTTNIIYYHSKY